MQNTGCHLRNQAVTIDCPIGALATTAIIIKHRVSQKCKTSMWVRLSWLENAYSLSLCFRRAILTHKVGQAEVTFSGISLANWNNWDKFYTEVLVGDCWLLTGIRWKNWIQISGHESIWIFEYLWVHDIMTSNALLLHITIPLSNG